MRSIRRLSKIQRRPTDSVQEDNVVVGRRAQGKQCAVCLNDSTSSSDYVNKQHHEC
jgi:hypothetical protein